MKNVGIVFLVLYFILISCVSAKGRSDANQPIEPEIEYLRSLSPEQQVDALIDMFRFSGGVPFQFFRYAYILTENPEAVKPVLFRYARETNPPHINDRSDMTYRLISIIIERHFLVENHLFTDDEKKILVEIYQEQLDYYLRTYKALDGMVFGLDLMIEYLTTGIALGVENPDYKFTLLQKYKDLGYGELINNLYMNTVENVEKTVRRME